MGKGKKPVYEAVEIEDIEYRGHGIARPGGMVLFVEDALPGEVVDARVIRKKKDYAFARVVRYHKRSEERTEPFCSHFGLCGGCRWQYLPYGKQLSYKQYFVEQTLRRIGKLSELDIRPILGCEADRYYRNKLEFSFVDGRWLTEEEIAAGVEVEDRRALGLHVRGRFDRVIDIETCYLQPDPSNRIRREVRDFTLERGYSYYDPASHEGYLRTLMIRTSLSGEVMVVVVFAGDDRPSREELLDFIAERFPQVTSLDYIINDTRNDAIAPHTVYPYAGRGYIREICGPNTLKIHPKSFYQTNPRQAVRLYEVVSELADLTGHETVYDLYCGIGSIALYLAGRAGRVIGVDNVAEAVENARENALHNGYNNCEFFTGNIRDVLTEGFIASHPAPDLVVLDPPRAGLHPEVVEALVALAAPHIVYVSCNPATQARDLTRLSDAYRVEAVQPVDMFPQTFHIETVVDLTRR
ncbi:MAG: 23S rRNA (uracil(1939)-C(5))-methyltransferase RlmD [Spirochaetaceae bacterium]